MRKYDVLNPMDHWNKSSLLQSSFIVENKLWQKQQKNPKFIKTLFL